MRRAIGVLLLCAASILSAADFQDFQAARAVIGQPSFSAHEKGVVAVALSLAKGNLYVADTSRHLLTFDISRIGAARTPGCPVCLVVPQSTAAQSVFEGVAAVAVNGHTIAIADPKSQRVMIWSGISPGSLLQGQPNVVLSGFTNPTSVALDNRRLFVGDAGSHHVFIWNELPASDSQLPDVTLGATDTADVGADTIQSPAALVSDGANLFVADAAAHRVLVFSPAEIEMPQAVNAATLGAGPLAPGTLVAIEHAASATATVFLNGNPVPVIDVSGDQLQVQIPYELDNTTAGSLWIRSQLEDGTASVSRPAAVRFTSASPGIFAFGAKEPRTGLMLHAPMNVPLSPEDPAKPSELLTVWATGLGAVASEANSDGAFDTLTPVHATINGNTIEVVSAVLPAEATGVYAVHLRMPAQLPPSATLVLLQNDFKSNAVTFPVDSTPQ